VPELWDDLEILQEVDRQQRQYGGGPLISNGLQLMEAIAGHTVADDGRIRGFVQELHIARDAGLLAFGVHDYHGPRADPSGNPHYYLQQITDFALTVTGQDRARGQRVVVPLPHPDEDDGRLVSSLILQDIADIIGTEYAPPSQVVVFLRESGIPLDRIPLPEGLRYWDVHGILIALDQWGSEGRRVLRLFIGQWLSNLLASGPSGHQQAAVTEKLARQGWHVRDGNLVIGERTTGTGVSGPLLAPESLHPWVWEAARTLWQSRHYRDAVRAAAAAITEHLQRRLGRFDVADDKLIQEAFSARPPEPGKPRLRVPGDHQNPTTASRQRGTLQLGLGCFFAIRNPAAHDTGEWSEQESLEQLAALSVFARLAEACTISK
jgi:hypothetical protein